MRIQSEGSIRYSKHPLKRILTVTNFISADYIEEAFHGNEVHRHQDAWELAYCVSGQLEVRKAADAPMLSASQFVLIPPGMEHDYDVPRSNARFFVLCFTLAGEENLMPFKDVIFTVDSFQKNLFNRMIVEICNAYEHDPEQKERFKILDFQPTRNDPLGGEQLIAASLEMILIYAIRGLTMQGDEIVRTEGFHKAVQDYLINSVQTYIQENSSTRLTVSDIAGHFNYSRTYFSSFYREATGHTLQETITNSVLEKAKKELSEKNSSISHTAAVLGFDSVQYFSHWFKRNTGLSPSDYVRMEIY